jgi:hypothetical protein
VIYYSEQLFSFYQFTKYVLVKTPRDKNTAASITTQNLVGNMEIHSIANDIHFRYCLHSVNYCKEKK